MNMLLDACLLLKLTLLFFGDLNVEFRLEKHLNLDFILLNNTFYSYNLSATTSEIIRPKPDSGSC